MDWGPYPFPLSVVTCVPLMPLFSRLFYSVFNLCMMVRRSSYLFCLSMFWFLLSESLVLLFLYFSLVHPDLLPYFQSFVFHLECPSFVESCASALSRNRNWIHPPPPRRFFHFSSAVGAVIFTFSRRKGISWLGLTSCILLTVGNFILSSSWLCPLSLSLPLVFAVCFLR